jgi:hypothetical protein
MNNMTSQIKFIYFQKKITMVSRLEKICSYLIGQFNYST